MIKKLLLTAFATVAFPVAALANWTLIVPQAPGGGTSTWAEIVARHLEPHVEGNIAIRHIPGAKDIPGFNEFHRSLRFDDRTIMVSHGGNGIGFLVDDVEYDYSEYDSIGMMNLNIVVGRHSEPETRTRFRIAGSSGMEPDGMAIAMLKCGNLPTVDDYVKCWDENIVWVSGMSGGERRLSFQRRETDVARESTANWIRHHQDAEGVEVWFHHGIYDLDTGQQNDDPNFPEGYRFEDVFYNTWGEMPEGPMYDAYTLSRNFRDVLQKALWVNKGNPHVEELREGLRNMLLDEDAMIAFEQDAGKYEWIVGEDGNQVVDRLRENVTLEKLENLVKWHENAYRFPSVFKPELVLE